MKKIISIKIIAIIFLILFLSPIFFPHTEAGLFKRKKTIKIAFIWQRWDLLDLPARINMMIYKRILRKAEDTYDVDFEIYEFWDRWKGGDVQQGKLRKMDVDVVIGPGGFGGWNSPREYRMEIKRFVRSGGGFYGICGDSTFGSLGVINLPKSYKIPLKRALGFRDFTPMLGLANVVTDASAFDKLLRFPFWFMKTEMITTVGKLPISRGAIRIEPADIPIQEPHYRDRIRVMLGNAPLVDGPVLFRFFMPKVYDIAIFKKSDDPYDQSLRGKKAIVATRYWRGRVILSVAHPELTIGNTKAHDVFVRNVLWCAKRLPAS